MGGSCQVSRPMNNPLFTQAFGDAIPGNDVLPAKTTHDVPPIKYAPKWMRRSARVSFAVILSWIGKRMFHDHFFLSMFVLVRWKIGDCSTSRVQFIE